VSVRKDRKKERKERNRVRSTNKVQSFGVVIIIVDACVVLCLCLCLCLRQEGGQGERAMVDIFSVSEKDQMYEGIPYCICECCMKKESGRYSGRFPGF
jgi:hypothetical protein